MAQATQRQALESLLGDEDEATRALTISQLRAHRADYEPWVRELQSCANARVRDAVRRILQEWEPGAGAPSPEPASPAPLETWEQLEHFCWMLAKTEQPALQESGYVKTLDAWGLRLAAVVGGAAGAEHKARALRLVLAGELGLRGNRSDYYAPANSYLDRVLETRMGIPLSLSLVYLFAARRAGWEAWGVATPGHYLMAVEGLILDPYFGGVLLTPEVLAERFAMPAEACRQPGFFRASPADTAQRMLANLLNSYTRLGDAARCRRIRAYLNILQENTP